MDNIVKGMIIELEPDKHLMVVRWYTDKYPPVAVDTNKRSDGFPVRCDSDRAYTVWDVPFPTGDALMKLMSDLGNQQQPIYDLREKIDNPNLDTTMKNAKAVMMQEFKSVPIVPSVISMPVPSRIEPLRV